MAQSACVRACVLFEEMSLQADTDLYLILGILWMACLGVLDRLKVALDLSRVLKTFVRILDEGQHPFSVSNAFDAQFFLQSMLWLLRLFGCDISLNVLLLHCRHRRCWGWWLGQEIKVCPHRKGRERSKMSSVKAFWVQPSEASSASLDMTQRGFF